MQQKCEKSGLETITGIEAQSKHKVQLGFKKLLVVIVAMGAYPGALKMQKV